MKEEIIKKYKKRLKNLKTTQSEQGESMTDQEQYDLEHQIRDVAEFIQDLKKL
jgi:hypothetical protein